MTTDINVFSKHKYCYTELSSYIITMQPSIKTNMEQMVTSNRFFQNTLHMLQNEHNSLK